MATGRWSQYDRHSAGAGEFIIEAGVERVPRSRIPTRPTSSFAARGQSMVEFALVIPILVILFVGIADFGRIFNAGVIVEAATRDAAEHAAQKYIAAPPGNPSDPPAVRLAAPPPPADSSYYSDLHVDAAKAVCAESRQLPNADFSSGTCATWPVVGVCVHDGADPICGVPPPGFAASHPAECGELDQPWDASAGSSERWVEVRTCYKFTALLRLPLFSLGDFYVQRTRSFAIPCYFATGYGGCP
ncbi:MAG TPA: TadE/TadG family type IV pilus assembly protein [Candidatus Limnocylindrales bacterium]|nr:TadE/TadG family type IV pilus assembly protein [Candidatus Limnocylindrales bacterium]